MHLSLEIFNRLWKLLEEACRELDFRLAVEHEGSVSDSHSMSSSSFKRLSLLKMELETQDKYANLITEMMTYSTLSVDSGNSDILDSFRAELTVAQKGIHDTVYYLIKVHKYPLPHSNVVKTGYRNIQT